MRVSCFAVPHPMRAIGRTAVAASALLAGGAAAQNIDYDAFELFAGEPATASATGSPLRASDAPANVEIVTQETIRQSGARDIPTLLRRVPGLQVWSTSAGSSEVAIRGLNQGYSRRILVMLDGRTVFNDAYANIAWSTIPVELQEIRQIEIVRGPNVALFGFNAVAGVINIITYDALRDTTIAASLRGGEDDYVQASAVLSKTFGDRFGLRVSAGATSEDAFRNTTANNLAIGREDGESWRTSLSAALRANDCLTLHADLSASGATASEFLVTGTQQSSTYARHMASVGFDYELQSVSVSGRVNYAAVDQEVGDAGRSNDLDLDLNLETDAWNAQLNAFWKPAPNHILRGGAEFRRVTSGQQPVDLGDVAYNIFSASALWNWAATDRLSFNLSGRVDQLSLDFDGDQSTLLNPADFSRTITEGSANAAVVWRATDKDTFRVVFGRGALLPSLLEFGAFVAPVEFDFGPQVIAGDLLIGDPNAEVARTHEIQGIYDRTFSRINAKLSLAVFQRWDDIFLSPLEGFVAGASGIIDVGEGGPNDPLPGMSAQGSAIPNAGDFETLGFEARLSGRAKWNLRYDINYAFLDVTRDLTEIGEEIDAFNSPSLGPAQATPNHTLNLILGYDRDRFSAEVSANWVDGYDVVIVSDLVDTFGQVIAIPSRWRLGARIAYALTDRIEMEAVIDNALDDSYPESPFLETERRAFLGVAFRY